MNNIYMGPGSVAGLPTSGRVNQDWEILLKCYATAYDSQNEMMLSPQREKFNPTTLGEIKRRFADLKRLARKYSPHKLRTVEALEKLAIANHTGKIGDRAYVHRLRLLSLQHGVNPMFLDQAEARINAAEGFQQRHFPPNVPPKSPMNDMLKEAGKTFENVNKGRGLFKPPEIRERRGKRKSRAPMTPIDLIRQMFGGGR